MTVTTTVIFAGVLFLSMQFQESRYYSRTILLVAWLTSLLIVPIIRALIRIFLSPRSWWGYPIVFFGACGTSKRIIDTILLHPSLGLKPVAILNGGKKNSEYRGIPIIGEESLLACDIYRNKKVPYAVVVKPELTPEELNEYIDRYNDSFPHMMIIPNLLRLNSLWVISKDVGGHLGLEIRQKLLLPGPRFFKNVIQYSLSFIAVLIFAVPILLLLSLLIKLTSRGPVFFKQKRIGYGGREFTAYKFRTMRQDADEVLHQYLDEHPELKEEWEKEQKLKNDPRCTAIGRLLRKMSLDELPQVINILLGEMSLVGPRPIVKDEIPKYGSAFEVYSRVKPGLTGLWQVSGRNNLPYEERVRLDEYYVRNWSVWLDIYILFRTPYVVIKQEGAY